MENPTQFILGLVFGIIGLGYFSYAKRQKSVMLLLVAVSLFLFPYFVSNVILLLIIGAVLVLLPFILRN